MKKFILLIVFILAAYSQSPIKSQDISIKESVSYINTLLEENPYVLTFLEITFFYSIDITSDKELVVKMEFEGPYKSFIKAEISDLDLTFKKDFCRENTNSICWNCISKDLSADNNCVYNENIYLEGGEEIRYTDNICVQFSNENNICGELYSALDSLFKKVMESELKE